MTHNRHNIEDNNGFAINRNTANNGDNKNLINVIFMGRFKSFPFSLVFDYFIIIDSIK